MTARTALRRSRVSPSVTAELNRQTMAAATSTRLKRSSGRPPAATAVSWPMIRQVKRTNRSQEGRFDEQHGNRQSHVQ